MMTVFLLDKKMFLAFFIVTSDPESANVILTAGHGGLKFWDLR